MRRARDPNGELERERGGGGREGGEDGGILSLSPTQAWLSPG